MLISFFVFTASVIGVSGAELSAPQGKAAANVSDARFEADFEQQFSAFLDSVRISSATILRDGKVVFEHPKAKDQGAQPLSSITKSIVALVLARVQTIKNKSYEESYLKEFFPSTRGTPLGEWVQVKHILHHTSCLGSKVEVGNPLRIYAHKDFVKYGLNLELRCRPGSRLWYNNAAVNLLPEIIRIIDGRDAEKIFRDDIMAPLGMDNLLWRRDEAGNVQGLQGIWLKAHDVALIGDLVLNGGRWRNRVIIDEKYMKSLAHYGTAADSPSRLWFKDRRTLYFGWRLSPWHYSRKDSDFLLSEVVYSTGSLASQLLIFPSHRMVMVYLWEWNWNGEDFDKDDYQAEIIAKTDCFFYNYVLRQYDPFCLR